MWLFIMLLGCGMAVTLVTFVIWDHLHDRAHERESERFDDIDGKG